MAGEKSQIQKSVRAREFWQIPLVGIQDINYVKLIMSESVRRGLSSQASKKFHLEKSEKDKQLPPYLCTPLF